MAEVTGFTADKMREMEDANITGAHLDGYDLVLVSHDGTEYNVGNVRGDIGPIGPIGEVSQAEFDALAAQVLANENDIASNAGEIAVMLEANRQGGRWTRDGLPAGNHATNTWHEFMPGTEHWVSDDFEGFVNDGVRWNGAVPILSTVEAMMMWQASSAGSRRLRIIHNDSDDISYVNTLAVAGSSLGLYAACTLILNPGDTIKMSTYHNHGSNLGIVGGQNVAFGIHSHAYM